ncbi:ribonuclease HI family protein [Candidatus Parcubacteria bacterium]|nr:ribonuclease HI family protein [Candidatus Parcubacteria bacterium]
MSNIIVYTDGGARGNPGPAAIGVVIESPEIGKKKFGEYIGETTNNEAEYRALALALKKVRDLFGSDKLSDYTISCYADSELMVKQLNGEYKVREANLQKLFKEVWNLKVDLGVPITFHHVPRAKNAEADELVNEVLDKETNKLPL